MKQNKTHIINKQTKKLINPAHQIHKSPTKNENAFIRKKIIFLYFIYLFKHFVITFCLTAAISAQQSSVWC